MRVRRFGFSGTGGWTADPADAGPPGSARLVTVFGGGAFRDVASPFETLRHAHPDAVLVGCSTAGEIHGDAIHDESLSVAVTTFEHTRLSHATTAVSDAADSFAAGARLSQQLVDDELRAVFVLSDGLGVNGSELVRGLRSAVGEHVVVTGGLAGDGERFAATWVLDGGQPRPGVVAAVGFHGDRIEVGHGSWGGWQGFGPERTITRADGNVLHELDDRPALELYKTYLGPRAEQLPASALLFPLALWFDGGPPEGVVRTILSVDEGDQSMTFAGDVPAGGRVRLMRAAPEELVEGAAEAARRAMPQNGEIRRGPCLAVAISCVGRRIVLGERCEDELEASLDHLPADTELVGFYSYGEIAPSGAAPAALHNQTMTLTTIRER